VDEETATDEAPLLDEAFDELAPPEPRGGSMIASPPQAMRNERAKAKRSSMWDKVNPPGGSRKAHRGGLAPRRSARTIGAMRSTMLLAVLGGVACGGPAAGPRPQPQVQVAAPAPEHATPGPRATTPDLKPVTPAEHFALAQGDYRAELRVWPAGDSRIRFELEVGAGGCTGMLEGDAREHPNADLGAESRELDGEMVFVDQYFYETPDCSLSVLVDGDHDHAWVEVAECSIQAEACPFGDVGSFFRVGR